MKKVKPKKIGKLSLIRKCLRIAPNHCGYCGKRYVDCYSRKVNILMPIPINGKCCPNGHEGYVDEFVGWGTVRYKFDYIKS